MYSKKVSTTFPALIAFLIDDSGSMGDMLPGTSDAKSCWVERYFGLILELLLARSTQIVGDTALVKPRYHVIVILYGDHTQVWGKGLMAIDEAVELFAANGNSLGLGGKLGGTDAAAGMKEAQRLMLEALANPMFKDSFPGLLFHLTDGESATDASAVAAEIQQMGTTDGHVLLVNGYIGTSTDLQYTGPQDFPGYLEASEVGSAEDNLRLFHMSSLMPTCIYENLKSDGIFPQIRPGCRMFFDIRTQEMLREVIQVVGSVGSRGDRDRK